jgi:hypothetical protein
MANGRNIARKGYDLNRDSGGFIALPWSVLDCPAYRRLSHPAKALLLEVARQFVRNNNGRLLLSRAYLLSRGWKSSDTITRAKRELLNGGFIYETVMGHRPNKASWYAVTWLGLDKLPGYDPGVTEGFRRSTYLQSAPLKNASLKPPGGTVKTVIAPLKGTETFAVVPLDGTVKTVLCRTPIPSDGNHLDKPSVAVQGSQSLRSFQLGCSTTET